MKPRVRVLALGNPMASDDGAAIEAAQRVAPRPGVEIVIAGRPGAGLLDLLDPDVPLVLVDVVRMGGKIGSVVELPLAEVQRASVDGKPISSHGFGPAQALALAEALGRPLPRGIFLGIGGTCFEPGTQLSPELAPAVDDLVDAIDGAIDGLLEAALPETGT